MSIISNNIRIMRIQLGMTQEELATKMGYKSKSTINKIELGVNDIPQSKIKKFADVLGTTPKALMGWEEEIKKNDTTVDVIQRLRTDEVFFEVVCTMYKLDSTKLEGVKQLLAAFLK